MMATMQGEQLVIANQLHELRRMTQWLHDSGQALGIAEDALFRLDVCANEAVTNIIDYAFVDNRRHNICIEMNKTPAGAILVIRDDGVNFNPLDMPEHQTPATLAEAAIGGLGIRLIKRMTSRCSFKRANGLNVLTLEV